MGVRDTVCVQNIADIVACMKFASAARTNESYSKSNKKKNSVNCKLQELGWPELNLDGRH